MSPDRTANLGLMQVTGRTQTPAMVYTVALGHFSQQLAYNQDPLLLWFQLLKAFGREGNLIAIFQDEHSRVLQQLQAFTFFPESQVAPKKTFERKSMERQSARRQPLIGLVSSLCLIRACRAQDRRSHLPCSSAADLPPAVRGHPSCPPGPLSPRESLPGRPQFQRCPRPGCLPVGRRHCGRHQEEGPHGQPESLAHR